MNAAARKPIGVFDSGLGGLTAVRSLGELLPNEDVVFFGDTARVPYGSRPAETIIRYALDDISFLLSHDVKLIIAACGTVSSTLPASFADRIPVPYITVVPPTASAAAKATRNKRVGVIATRATIRSGAFERALKELDGDIEVVSNACPMFVPLVENGYVARDCEMTRLAAREYLAPLKAAGVDAAILGCTHYPLIRGIIADELGENVALIDSGRETAKRAADYLRANGLLNEGGGNRRFFASDSPDGFGALAGMFLGSRCAVEAAKPVELNKAFR